jgi:NADH-quinone oxidoreductase subunit M
MLAGTSIILGAVYMLAVYKKTFFGPVTNEANLKLKDLDTRELWSLLPLVAIVIWLGVYPKPVLGPIDNSVNAMLSFMDEKAITVKAKDMIRTAKTKIIIIEEVK